MSLREIRGNIWDYANKNTVVCILVNNTNNRGRNPMGGGIAREALDRNPGIDKLVVESIKHSSHSLGKDSITDAVLYRFTTKQEIWLPSTLDVIEQSLKHLAEYMKLMPYFTFLLPRPGCGFGGLDWDTQVKPLCEKYLAKLKNYYIFSY